MDALYDDRYGYSGRFPLDRCSACGHRSIPVVFEPPELRRLYSQFYPRSTFELEDFRPHQETSGLRAWWNGERSAAFRWVPSNVRVLDIGCGFGQTLAYHQARGCDAHGIDADENILRVAQRYGLKARAGLFDASAYEPDSFDYVTLDQVLEHSTDPRSLLKGVAKVLRQGGHAILTTPNASGLGVRVFGRYWLHWHCPYHVQFFTRRSLQITAESAGLQVVGRRTITSSEWLNYQWLHLLTYPRPGEPSTFWTSSGRPRLIYRALHRAAGVLHRLRVNHLLTRLLDALNLGDNQVLFLRRLA
jgi:2-polyprenyl-3-methyl-5-hydroxy-6-metoxy-1,4-benzoquinol methylase